MPGFGQQLSATEMWQDSLRVANADKLPGSVKAFLTGLNAPPRLRRRHPVITKAPASRGRAQPAQVIVARVFARCGAGILPAVFVLCCGGTPQARQANTCATSAGRLRYTPGVSPKAPVTCSMYAFASNFFDVPAYDIYRMVP